MVVLNFILYLLAAISFLLVTFRVAARIEFVGLGLLFMVLVPLIATARGIA